MGGRAAPIEAVNLLPVQPLPALLPLPAFPPPHAAAEPERSEDEYRYHGDPEQEVQRGDDR